MIEQLRTGFLGLFLVMGQWLSPGNDLADISVSSIKPTPLHYQLQCELHIGWNQELEALLNAGIPLRFRIGAFCPGCDSLVFVRELRFDVVKTNYSFTDQYEGASRDSVAQSRKYPQVLLALRDLSRWSFLICKSATDCRIEVELLPSRATRLNRTVDMSVIWGQRRISKVLVLNADGASGGDQ